MQQVVSPSPSGFGVNHTRPNTQKAQKFKGGLPANAFSQLISDTMGVWAPKVPLTRSKQGFFEDAFLEWAENIPFYLLVPVVAPLLAKRFAGKTLNPNEIGSSWDVLGQQASKAVGKGKQVVGKELLGAKAGTVISVLSLCFGWEYMVQHAKNYITAKQFKTKNFAAVAGLSDKTTEVKTGHSDPVEKAEKRAKQIAGLVTGGLLLGAAAPTLVKKSSAIENTARKLLRYFNFSGNNFDVNKSILGSVIGVGVVSYLDAARDKLELKETASRLALIVPYLLFGKEISGNILASVFNRLKVETGKDKQGEPEKVAFRDALKHLESSKTGEAGPEFSFRKSNSLWKQFKTPESFLNLAHSKEKSEISKEFETLAKKGFNIPEATKTAIAAKVGQIRLGQFVLGALISGAGITWFTYQQTNRRWDKAKEKFEPSVQSRAVETKTGIPSFQQPSATQTPTTHLPLSVSQTFPAIQQPTLQPAFANPQFSHPHQQ
jgi:hypothetical protein